MPGKADRTPACLSRAAVAALPDEPGVYLFRDASGEVIYVGKAASLKSRVASYRAPAASLPRKTVVMLGRAASLETIVTATEKEALLLEASLIKKHRPRYNVVLRDDKNYPWLKLTLNEEWPRLAVSRRRRDDGARYFGPFASAGALRETIRVLGRIFPLRKCRNAVMRNQKRPCLDFQMGRCLAPCCGLAGKEEYRAMVRDLIDVLEGRNRRVERRLEAEMNRAAETLAFERAAILRDRLADLRRTLERQAVVTGARAFFDVFSLVSKEGGSLVALLRVRGGMITGTAEFYLPEAAGSPADIISQLLRRFYSGDTDIPPEILLSLLPDDRTAVEEWLSAAAGRMVRLAVPARGGRRRLLDMAENNAVRGLEKRGKMAADWENVAAELEKTLGLARPPVLVECVDISTTGGREPVGALVCFAGGAPDKARWRHYNIREVEGQDDYAMMREVVARRLEHGDLPDVLLLDGGRGHLAAVKPLLRERGAAAPALAAIAKGRGRGPDRVFVPGNREPLELDPASPALFFLMRIRDEAHRFGITRHRRRRDRAGLASRLDRISGVGPARKRALIAAFGSVRGISEAAVEDIAAVRGVGPELAARIKETLAGG